MNQEPNNIFPFEGFIAYLQHNNYNVGVDTYLRVQELMNHLEPNTPIQRLRHILCPIFAQNPDEQEKFYYLFDAYFTKFDILDENEFSEIHEDKTTLINNVENPSITKTKWKLPKRWQAILFTVVLTIILGLLANIGWKFYTNYEESFEYFHETYQVEKPKKRDRFQYAWEELRDKGHICDSLSAKFDYTYKIEGKKYVVTIYQIPQTAKDNYKWTINGQSFASKEATITQTFTTTGNYPVQLEVTNQDSCKQSFSQTINIPVPHNLALHLVLAISQLLLLLQM